MTGKKNVKAAAREEGEEGKQTTSSSTPLSHSQSLSSSSSSSSDEREYEVQDLRDRLKSSRGSRFDLIQNELGLNSRWSKFSRQALLHGIRGFSEDFVIHPDNRFRLLQLPLFLPFNRDWVNLLIIYWLQSVYVLIITIMGYLLLPPSVCLFRIICQNIIINIIPFLLFFILL